MRGDARARRRRGASSVLGLALAGLARLLGLLLRRGAASGASSGTSTGPTGSRSARGSSSGASRVASASATVASPSRPRRRSSRWHSKMKRTRRRRSSSLIDVELDRAAALRGRCARRGPSPRRRDAGRERELERQLVADRERVGARQQQAAAADVDGEALDPHARRARAYTSTGRAERMRTYSRSWSTSTERGAPSVISSGLAASWLATVPRRRTRPRALENSTIRLLELLRRQLAHAHGDRHHQRVRAALEHLRRDPAGAADREREPARRRSGSATGSAAGCFERRIFTAAPSRRGPRGRAGAAASRRRGRGRACTRARARSGRPPRSRRRSGRSRRRA